jgi:competence protein ComEC
VLILAAAVSLLTAALLQLPALPPPWSLLLVGVLVLLAPCWLPRGAGTTRWRLLPVLLLAQLINVLLDAQRWEARRLSPACERQEVTVKGELRGLPQHFGTGARRYQRAELAVHDLSPARCAGPRRLRLYLPDQVDATPGSSLQLRAVLRRPWGLRNPHGSSTQTALFQEGIHGLGSVREVLSRDFSAPLSLPARVDRWRQSLSRTMREALSAPTARLLPALLLGDRRAMTPADWERLRVFGITHLLVISGLHVSLAAFLGYVLGRALCLFAAAAGAGPARALLAPVGALALAALYTLLSGSGLPALRALLMLVPASLLWALGRGRSAWSLLGLACLLLLLFQPRAVLGMSLWLSLSAVGFLLWFSTASQRASGSALQTATLKITRLQGYMTLAMLPLGLAFFGSASALGAAANLVAIPLIGLWVVPLGLAGLVINDLLPGVAAVAWQSAALPLEVFWHALDYWQDRASPWLALNTTARPAAATALLLAAVLLLPAPLPGRRFAAAALLAIPQLLLPPPGRSEAEALFFDVGQGTAVLLRSGDLSVLYDTGAGGTTGPSLAERVILPYLAAQGIEELSLLVISHLDNDHSGGLGDLESKLPIQRRWSGPPLPGGFERCRPGRRLGLSPHFLVTSLSAAQASDSSNNQSCVLQVELHGLRVLLPGDVDRRREAELVAYWGGRLQSDVLLAAHHGSRSSSSRLFLRHVDPQLVIFTAGHANRFGHPVDEVRAAVADSGAGQYSSAEHGAIQLRYGQGEWRLHTERHRWRPFWWGASEPLGRQGLPLPSGVILRRSP